MNVLDLFSGIGGFSLGLERTGGFRTVAFCESDLFCQCVLAQHWPDVPVHGDVARLPDVDADFITAGWPCQDISQAGSGAGLAGERSGLFRHVVRAFRLVRPKGGLLENVAALLDRGMGEVCGAMAEIGYDLEWDCIPAAAVGAPHERDRIFISAHPDTEHGQAGMGVLALNEGAILQAHHRNRASVWLETTCRSARMGNGFSDFMDRRERTEVVGNAVVPQVVELVGNAILEAEMRAAA